MKRHTLSPAPGVPLSRKVQIKPADPQDVDDLVPLLRQLFSIESDFDFNEVRQRRGLVMMLDGCGKHRCLLVAVVDNRVVGMVSAQTLISTAEGGLAAVVEDLVVADQWRDQGIGRMLVHAVERWAADRGIGRLQLLADRNNRRALQFYARHNWKTTRLICLRKTGRP
jgi:GNAT superfamily N-acetyltransferase